MVLLFCDNSLIVDDSEKGGIILIVRSRRRGTSGGERVKEKSDRARNVGVEEEVKKDKADARQQ